MLGAVLSPSYLPGFSIEANWYDIKVEDAIQKISREGTEQGAPSQAFPKWKSVGIIDWDLAEFGATLTGRYVSKLEDTLGGLAKIDSVFYTDAQVRWLPGFVDDFGLALGVNNLFDVKAPGCLGCETNNLAVTVHDVPGRYWYARATFEM